MDRAPAGVNVDMLMKRALEGDGEAFWSLVRDHERLIFAVALGILRDGDAAQDVVHDVYLRAFSTLGNLRSPSKLGSWLYTMTRNMSYEYLRKVQRQERIAETQPRETVISVPDMLIEEEELQAMEHAMAELPETHRVVLGMKYMNNMSCREIAETLGIGVEAAKSRLFEARKALRARMLAAGENPALAHPAPTGRGGQTAVPQSGAARKVSES